VSAVREGALAQQAATCGAQLVSTLETDVAQLCLQTVTAIDFGFYKCRLCAPVMPGCNVTQRLPMVVAKWRKR
jgi:hypothetical protein